MKTCEHKRSKENIWRQHFWLFSVKVIIKKINHYGNIRAGKIPSGIYSVEIIHKMENGKWKRTFGFYFSKSRKISVPVMNCKLLVTQLYWQCYRSTRSITLFLALQYFSLFKLKVVSNRLPLFSLPFPFQ